MEQVKYRLTDRWLDPPATQADYLEELVYLPGGFVCYYPGMDLPTIGPAPVLENGYITFGSFNNLLKINDDTLTLWTEVLKAVPDSRLLLKFPGSHDPILANGLVERFRTRGIAPERLHIAGYCRSFTDHIQHYHAVDIALDTCHFNGCVTTLEGLWMGVPLVNLVGERYTGRTGLSLLTQLELAFFCAGTPREFVAKARTLAAQVPSLVQLRATLRQRMLSSTLCDSQRYARELEAAFRMIWQRHCREGGTGRAARSRLSACPSGNRGSLL
jgi:predicted O-linked N-acetylglucosamine transferase (SPINDLY family)